MTDQDNMADAAIAEKQMEAASNPAATTTSKPPSPPYNDTQPPSAQEVKLEKRRITKNVILISLAFLFNFTSFGGLSRLQSSLHRIPNMGTINLAVLYTALMLSCMFLPTLVIRFIGHRRTIAISFSGYILYMAANGYAVWATMIPASVLVGICAAPLWTAQCSYFTIIGARYARYSGESADAVVSRFFGIFFMFFQLCEYSRAVTFTEGTMYTANLWSTAHIVWAYS